MKKLTRLIAALLTLAAALALSLPACAAQEGREIPSTPVVTAQAPTSLAASANGFTDVDAGAWYAGAVNYVQEAGLMNGVGGAVSTRTAPSPGPCWSPSCGGRRINRW